MTVTDATQADLQKAKELIQAKKYPEAKTLLRKIDHPKAKEWLAKLPATTRPALPIGWIALVMVVGIVAAGAGILIGRELMRAEFNNAVASIFNPTAIASERQSFDATTTQITTDTKATQSALLTPAANSDYLPALYGGIQLRAVQVERPSTVPITSTMGGDLSPTTGTEYVAVQFEMQCAPTEITCYTSGATPSLLLVDGRTAYPLSTGMLYTITTGDDTVVGGNSLLVWRVYEVPLGVDLQYIQFEARLGELP